jgi:RND family efflux transporter MFP subunit
MRNTSMLLRTWGLPTVLLAAAACGGGEDAPMPEVVRPVAMLTVGTAQNRGLMFPGTAQATERADLAFRVPGALLELPVNEGDRVIRGQLLARLDPIDFQLDLDQAKATFEKAEADYTRYKRLYEREAVSLAEVEANRAQRDVARARHEQARKNLGYTELRAPFSGRVGRKFVENFEDVPAKEVILSLQNLSAIEIVINVPEQVLALSREPGRQSMEAVATFSAAPDMEYPLTLKEVAAEADRRTQTFAATFTMPQPDEIQILAGMTAQVWVRTKSGVSVRETVETFLVPVTAVYADEAGSSHVWVYDPDSHLVRARAVTVGEVTPPNHIQILSGLAAGETIAIAAVNNLREDMQVRPLDSSQ